MSNILDPFSPSQVSPHVVARPSVGRRLMQNPRGRWNVFLAWLLLAMPAFAQQRTITVESSGMQPPVVIGRPMLTWWDVKITGPGLVVGHFLFTVKFEEQVLAVVETEEITVNGPEQRIRVMLPAIDESLPFDQLKVDIAIRGKTLNTKLQQQVLRVPFASKKVFMGLVAEPRLGRKRSSQRQTILEHLKFETLVQDELQPAAVEDSSFAIKTILTSIDSGDLPSDPLAYCGFDLVVLMDEEFRTLRKPQLEAMLAWIKAGGNLFIEPKGVLEPFHLDFLRSLVAQDPRAIVIQTDPAGRIPADIVPVNDIALVLRCGLGHIAIRTDDSDRELPKSKEAWQGLTGKLWNVRFRPVPQPELSRQIVVNGRPEMETVPNPDPFGLKSPFLNRLRLPITELLERLMPEGVRMVPLWVLSTILVIFVLMIGPADYYILGWLRLRKFTWLTFPTATIAVTVLTIWLSNSYMSAAEARRAVIIRDLDQAGETIRTNRFELLYLAASRRVSTDLEKGLFSPLKSSSGIDTFAAMTVNRQSAGPPVVSGYQISTEGQIIAIPPVFEGRIPTQYAASQELHKWTPQLNRVLSIPGPSENLEVKWDEFSLNSIQAQSLARREIPVHILESAKRQFGANVMVACLMGNDQWAYNRTAGWSATQTADVTSIRQRAQFAPWTSINNLAIGEAPFFRWIYQVSAAPTSPGLFSVIKQLTPKGGAFCDDLPILDTTDPQSWLLVIVVPGKDEFIVYRKLMQLVN